MLGPHRGPVAAKAASRVINPSRAQEKRHFERTVCVKAELKHVGSDLSQSIVVERTTDEAGACEAKIGDRLVSVEVEQADASSGRLRIGNCVHRYHVLQRDKTMHVWVDGKTYVFDRVDSTARRAGASGAGPASNQLTAPMPGTVLKINGEAGDRFEAHAPIVVMESMKMEMSLSAPTDVILKSVECEAGQLVEMGLVLAKLEPMPDGE